MKRTYGMAALAWLLVAQPVWAARTPVHEAAESPEYGRKFGGMIGRGVINATTSFVDLLVDVTNETRNGPPFVGTLVGLGKGIGCTTLRMLSGGVDLLTFWVPGFNGIPVSDSYENCLAGISASSESAMSTGAAPSSIPTGEGGWQQPSMTSPSGGSRAPAKEEKPRYTK